MSSSISRAFVALVLAISLASCTTASSGARSSSWVGTWGASPTVPAQNAPGFKNQTLRLLVHTTLGGESVRVRVCNTFGQQRLEVGSVALGLPQARAALVASSVALVKFQGHATASIPAGGSLLSDPVRFAAPTDGMVAISLFLPSATGAPSVHPLATQTSFVSGEGNFAASVAGEPFATEISTWPLLCGLDVRPAHPTRTIVTFGDSITDGARSTQNANRRWPDVLSQRLHEVGREVAVVNAGISGNRILHDATKERIIFGPSGASRFERDVLGVSGVTHVVVLIGINDIGQATPARNPGEMVSAEEIIAGLRDFIKRGHARGVKMIGATLTPIGAGGVYDSELNETKRQAVNTWLRSSHEFDALIDFDAATRDSEDPKRFRAAYDSGDHLHPNDAGYRAMAESVDLSVFD